MSKFSSLRKEQLFSHQMAEPGEGAGELLLDLVAAVGAGHVHDEAQLPRRVVHVLSLELLQLGLVGPRDPLVEVNLRNS